MHTYPDAMAKALRQSLADRQKPPHHKRLGGSPRQFAKLRRIKRQPGDPHRHRRSTSHSERAQRTIPPRAGGNRIRANASAGWYETVRKFNR